MSEDFSKGKRGPVVKPDPNKVRILFVWMRILSSILKTLCMMLAAGIIKP